MGHSHRRRSEHRSSHNNNTNNNSRTRSFQAKYCKNTPTTCENTTTIWMCCCCIVIVIMILFLMGGVGIYVMYTWTEMTTNVPDTIIPLSSSTVYVSASSTTNMESVRAPETTTIISETPYQATQQSPTSSTITISHNIPIQPIIIPDIAVTVDDANVNTFSAQTPLSTKDAHPSCAEGYVTCYRPHPPAECSDVHYVCGKTSADCYGCPMVVIPFTSSKESLTSTTTSPIIIAATSTPITTSHHIINTLSGIAPRELIALDHAPCPELMSASAVSSSNNYCYTNTYEAGRVQSFILNNYTGTIIPRHSPSYSSSSVSSQWSFGFHQDSIAAFMGLFRHGGTKQNTSPLSYSQQTQSLVISPGHVLPPPQQGCIYSIHGIDDPTCSKGIPIPPSDTHPPCCNTNIGLAPGTGQFDVDTHCGKTTHTCLPCAPGTRAHMAGMVRLIDNTPATVYTCVPPYCGPHAHFVDLQNQCQCDVGWGGPECSVPTPTDFAMCSPGVLPTTHACQTPGSTTECVDSTTKTELIIWADLGSFSIPNSYMNESSITTTSSNNCVVSAKYCNAVCTPVPIQQYTLHMCQCTRAPTWW